MLDYEALSSELLRSLRGKRSQAAFSRRLGYRSNVVRTWENGHRFPTAARLLQAARRVGLEPRAALGRFLSGDPRWLSELDPATSEGVQQLLADLRGGQKILEVAQRAQRSRYATARWLSGAAEPRVPDFLRLIEACSLRVLDFVACFADPSALPSVADAWARLEEARAVAFELPWSHAVLRALELESYRKLRTHRAGFIAAQLRIPIEEEERCLALLARSGQIRKRRGKYIPGRPLTVDTRMPSAGRKLVSFWAQAGVERMSAGSRGLFSYNLFTVSERDLVRLRELHLGYFRELRAIVAQSEPAERVVVANVQLFGLDE
jgi:transcriptional regulator with XRE-family HTH domain